MPDRPATVKIKTEIGIHRSVSSAPGNFKTLSKGSVPLYLGLGPEPATVLSKNFEQKGYYLECPEFIAAMPEGWTEQIPSWLIRLQPGELSSLPLNHLKVILYTPGLKCFPWFWTNILAEIRTAANKSKSVNPAPGKVILFGEKQSLLIPELYWELGSMGFEPVLLPSAVSPENLNIFLSQTEPAFALSVNLQGMDSYGENFALLDRHSIPMAIWMVDNPFHLLTRIRGSYWTRAHIFVTDKWFIPPLQDLGAKHTCHLPLAAAPGFYMSKRPAVTDLNQQIVFVGRSSFPEHDSFFSAVQRNPELENIARDIMLKGQRPDFAWWNDKLNAPCWPGNLIRQTGLGASQSGLHWKKVCLDMLARHYPLTVFGDKGWQDIVSNRIHLRGEVDYYGPLSAIYSSARCVLNLTNMIMPGGLTQRHFDVWAAGGTLLTDKTPGLDIFPQGLASEISFSTIDEMLSKMKRTYNDEKYRAQLGRKFYRIIRAEHTYANRIATVLKHLDIQCASSSLQTK
ncbi:glycosyltransferase family protein [Desulfonatronovibrio magnus]|uniref:glycosyltransferase family protein n=1 Tax=Desulfonatronovibrio magnus TaxID=698827 RepID=UPI0006974810|nr:DUF3880 domain-containing protein [Desulfonatronovibrio magnus]